MTPSFSSSSSFFLFLVIHPSVYPSIYLSIHSTIRRHFKQLKEQKPHPLIMVYIACETLQFDTAISLRLFLGSPFDSARHGSLLLCSAWLIPVFLSFLFYHFFRLMSTFAAWICDAQRVSFLYHIHSIFLSIILFSFALTYVNSAKRDL